MTTSEVVTEPQQSRGEKADRLCKQPLRQGGTGRDVIDDVLCLRLNSDNCNSAGFFEFLKQLANMSNWGDLEVRELLTLRAEDEINRHFSGTVKDGPLLVAVHLPLLF